VDFVTSPGWLEGDGSRERAGLRFGGVSRVVTTLGVFGFHPGSRRMQAEALHPGVSMDTVREHTGFEILEASRIEETQPPTSEELEILRAIDPDRRFLT
jgi:glutaconate CoA-transferase subunit B